MFFTELCWVGVFGDFACELKKNQPYRGDTRTQRCHFLRSQTKVLVFSSAATFQQHAFQSICCIAKSRSDVIETDHRPSTGPRSCPSLLAEHRQGTWSIRWCWGWLFLVMFFLQGPLPFCRTQSLWIYKTPEGRTYHISQQMFVNSVAFLGLCGFYSPKFTVTLYCSASQWLVFKSWWRRWGLKRCYKWSKGLKKRTQKVGGRVDTVQKPGRHVQCRQAHTVYVCIQIDFCKVSI